MNKDIAISVQNVSKTFRIPHEKITSIRGVFASAFQWRKKSYEEFNALNDISLEIRKGEFFGIIGRNGSGKSTLLKILANIYQPDKGKVSINGMISPFLELGIGFNPELSGRDNIYLNATVLGLTKKQIDAKFDEIVAFSELGRFIDQKLKNYSSGMQVRLAFSVSIHANREVLLMDEVLAVGDINFREKCFRVFQEYKSKGRTVLIVTHDIEVVRKYCDRAMLLQRGNMLITGGTNEVCNRYVYENMRESQELSKSKKEEKSSGGNSNTQASAGMLLNSPAVQVQKKYPLVMTLLARDEEDIIDQNIQFHLARGVDHIIATDNASIDDTRKIFKKYEEKGVLTLLDEPGRDHHQSKWVDRMAKIAVEQYDADAIFHCDADEFWTPISGSLKDEMLVRSEEVITTRIINVLMEDRGGKEFFVNDAKYACIRPITTMDYHADFEKLNFYLLPYPPKVFLNLRAKGRYQNMDMGNHKLDNALPDTTFGTTQAIVIYHYPIRSFEQFMRKARNGGSAKAQAKHLKEGQCFHFKSWYDKDALGGLRDEYNRFILDQQTANVLVKCGVLERILFKDLLEKSVK